jgi:hypothetical protein
MKRAARALALLREKLDHVVLPTRKISLSPSDTGLIERPALRAAGRGLSFGAIALES